MQSNAINKFIAMHSFIRTDTTATIPDTLVPLQMLTREAEEAW